MIQYQAVIIIFHQPILSTLTELTRLIHGCFSSSRLHRIRLFSMAWRSSGPSNEALITNLGRNGLIQSARVKEAMLKVRHACRGSDTKDRS